MRRGRMILLVWAVVVLILFMVSYWPDSFRPNLARKNEQIDPSVSLVHVTPKAMTKVSLSDPAQGAPDSTYNPVSLVHVLPKAMAKVSLSGPVQGAPATTYNPALICTPRNTQEVRAQDEVTKPDKPKLVLFYNFPWFYRLPKSSGLSAHSYCDHECEVTRNASRMQEADTVVFYSHGRSWNTTPPVKRQGQNWMYFAVEPPGMSGNHFRNPAWHSLFNWTMGYRHDSEVWHGYVRPVKRTIPVPQETRDKDIARWRGLFAKKTKMAAWFVSHCKTQSLREKYVAELSKYISVDIYGRCGTLKCAHRVKCLSILTDDYKFYLSFENSLCVDYVTEKLLNMLKLRSIIPVVRGGARYHDIFPANSVIDTADFPTPKSLAEHLKALANDEEAYIKHFQWSWEYEVEGNGALPLCDVCKQMHKKEPMSCVYKNVHSWWNIDTCHRPKDI